MMICVECGSKNKINKNCLNHYLVEIDNLICNSILKLNKKGFSTFTCCSGHNTEKSFYGYVCFDKRPLKKFGKPDGWEFDNILLDDEDEQKYWKQSKRTIRYFMEDSEDKSAKIRLMMKNLNEWVDGLPNLKGC